jgi:hypothetical protein
MFPPPEKPGMFQSEDDAVKKVVTLMVLAVFVITILLTCIAMITWTWRFLF